MRRDVGYCMDDLMDTSIIATDKKGWAVRARKRKVALFVGSPSLKLSNVQPWSIREIEEGEGVE